MKEENTKYGPGKNSGERGIVQQHARPDHPRKPVREGKKKKASTLGHKASDHPQGIEE